MSSSSSSTSPGFGDAMPTNATMPDEYNSLANFKVGKKIGKSIFNQIFYLTPTRALRSLFF